MKLSLQAFVPAPNFPALAWHVASALAFIPAKVTVTRWVPNTAGEQYPSRYERCGYSRTIPAVSDGDEGAGGDDRALRRHAAKFRGGAEPDHPFVDSPEEIRSPGVLDRSRWVGLNGVQRPHDLR